MAAPKRLSNTQKKKLRETVDRAQHAYQTGRYDICERLCKQVEAMQPEHADVAFLRGAMLLAMYGADQAIPFMQQAAERAPKRIEFQINLGTMYMQDMQFRLALECFEAAEKLDAKSSLALLGCCQALTGLNRHAEAREYLRRARALKIKQPQALMNLALACRDLGDMNDALQVLDDLSSRYPEFTQGVYTKALTAMQVGDVETAREAIRQTLALDPTHAQALTLMAESGSFDSPDDEGVALIRHALDVCPEVSRDRVYTLNAMALAQRKLGDHDAAFDYYRQANELRASLRDYDIDAALRDMDQIMLRYTPDVLARSEGVSDRTPIFVVGLPRCGSTLVEQILVAHSQVSGRGEIDAFSSVLREQLEVEGDIDVAGLASMLPGQWADAGREYIERLRKAGPDTPFIVDKSLNNVLYLGAIHCAMPHARIIHVRRHPLDVCLSIYTSNIQGSLYDYAFKLETLGAYCLKYLEVMRHWRKVLPAGVMYELEYEQLVADQKGETRGLLDACGLPWEDACLDFQKARQRVNTASIMQVRQSMYTKSVARWKRYERQLQPLIDILGTDYPPRD